MVEKSKKGKERWIRIMGSKEFNNAFLGESYTVDPETLIGKKVQVNLGSLLNDMKRQNSLVTFKIKETKGNEVYADFVSYEMVKAHTKRLVRAGQNKIDDSFIVEGKDKLKIG